MNSGGGFQIEDPWQDIEVDFDEVSWVKTHPTTFLEGDLPDHEEGNPIIRFRSPENNNDRKDQGYIGVVLDNPSVLVSEDEGTENTVVLETDDDDSTDYRIYNLDDKGTTEKDFGVAFSGDNRAGDKLDDFPDDVGRVIVTISSAAARNIARRLDVCGAETAGMDTSTGLVNDGLIEYAPDEVTDDQGRDEDGFRSRYARDPELREDMRGKRLGIFHTRREEVDEDYAEDVENDERRSMYWFSVFDMEAGESIKPTDEGEPKVVYEWDGSEYRNRTFLRDEWGQYDPDATSLPEDQQAFVDAWLDADQSTDEEDIREALDAEDDDTFEDEVRHDQIVAAIQNGA